jgi:hypothetical protein
MVANFGENSFENSYVRAGCDNASVFRGENPRDETSVVPDGSGNGALTCVVSDLLRKSGYLTVQRKDSHIAQRRATGFLDHL